LEGEETREEKADREFCDLANCPVEVEAAKRTDGVQVAGLLKNDKLKTTFETESKIIVFFCKCT
jgi:hypothetical protein